MIFISRNVRLVLAFAALLDLVVFSQHALMVILAQAIGIALIMVGMQYTYRPSSVLGLLVVATTSAAAISLPSLLEVGQIVTAMFSLAVPILVLTWLSLTAEEAESVDVVLLKRPAIISVAYALACIWSAPVMIFLMSLLTASASVRVSSTTEGTIVLIVAIAGAIMLTRNRPVMPVSAVET